MTIISCMVPEIWSTTDRIFLSFWNVFCPFTSLWTQKINILKKWKKTTEGIIILQMWAWQREFSVILDRFLTFYPPNNLKNQNFQKLKINSWTFYYFTLVYYKWQSYDVWFLRYRARQTGFFVILDHFLPFYPPNNPKN